MVFWNLVTFKILLSTSYWKLVINRAWLLCNDESIGLWKRTFSRIGNRIALHISRTSAVYTIFFAAVHKHFKGFNKEFLKPNSIYSQMIPNNVYDVQAISYPYLAPMRDLFIFIFVTSLIYKISGYISSQNSKGTFSRWGFWTVR